MSETEIEMEDGWSTNADYKKLYQSNDEIDETLDLLNLGGAEALLDVGCGNGELSLQAVATFPQLKIFGYDGLESAIAEARKRAALVEEADLTFEQSWADDLPLAEATADRALFRNVLHHIEKPRAVFGEIARCLRSKGLLVIQAPINRWEDSFSAFLTELHFLMDDSHRRFYYTPDQVCGDLEQAGFSIGETTFLTYPFPYISEPMKHLIVENGFEERLELHQVSEEKWSVTLGMGRFTAIRD